MTLNFLERWGLRLFGLTPEKFENALPAVAAIVADYQAAEPDIKAAIALWNDKIKPLVDRNRPRLEDAMKEIDAAMPAIQEALKLVGANRDAGKPMGKAVETTRQALKAATPGTTTKWLQETLTKLGYRVAVDGAYGAKTDAAVRAFQRDHKITVDGWAGAETTAMLRSALEAMA
jgi:murein L,D-transpeptidase YcbB/YkuD